MRRKFLGFSIRNKVMIILGSLPALMSFATINQTSLFTVFATFSLFPTSQTSLGLYTVSAETSFSPILCSSVKKRSMAVYSWTGSQSTDWHVGNNWLSGSTPTVMDDVTIGVVGTGNYPVISNANAVANSITIDAAASLTMQNSYNLTISSGGSFINNGSFDATANTGAVVFAGSGNISGSISFKNVIINGAVDFGTASTITGNLLINAGGSATGASTHLVNYTSSSLLIYNTTVVAGNEWYQGGSGTTTPGAGIPQSVTIQSGTITIPNTGGSNRALAGNLNINAGGALQFAVATTRDLFIAGNWSNAGVFTANGRRVTFDASTGVQTVSGNTTFYDLTLNNTGAITDFGTSVITIDHEFRGTNGTMNGNTSTFTFTGVPSGAYIEGSRSKNFYNLQINPGASVSDLTASAGDIHVANSLINNGTFNQHASHTIYFDKTNATETFSGAGSTTFGKLVIGDNGFSFPTTLNCTADFTVAGGSIVFYKNSIYNGINNTTTFSINNAAITGTGTANFNNATTNIALNPGSGISTIYNNFTLNTGGSTVTNAPMYGPSATLIYNTTTPGLNTNIEWTNNTASTGTGAPFNVTVQNTNSVVITGSRTVPGILSIAAGNTLDINGFMLTVNAGFSGIGKLKGSTTSGLTTSGTGTIYFSSVSPFNQLKTLTVSTGGNITLGGTSALGDTLNIAAGSFVSGYGIVTVDGQLNANGILNLKSEHFASARIAQSSGSITGNVTIERYIPANRAWRFMAIPFASSTQNINESWMEGATPNPVNNPVNNPKPGYGTEITYDNNIANGFDVNITANPSLITWDVINQKWSASAPNTFTTKITDYPAYCLFIRGSRAVPLWMGTNAPPDPTVLRITGQLNETGNNITKTIAGATAGQWVMVSNPFASPINLQAALNHAGSTGILKTQFKVWDSKLTGSNNVGAYVTNSAGIWAPAGVGSSYSAGDMPIILNGQAFMIQLNGSSPQIEFQQADKFSGEQLEVFGLQAKKLPVPVIYTNLMVSDGSNLFLTDGVAAGFGKQYSTGIDDYDAAKLWNFDENIALIRNEKPFAIEFRPMPSKADTLFYRLYLRQKPYTLKIFAGRLPTSLPVKAWLVDRYLDIQTEVNLYDTTLYNFTPNTDTNSYRNRFMLVFNHTKGKSTGNISIGNKTAAHIYPNPVNSKTFTLVLENATKGEYTVNIFTADGKLTAQHKINFQYGSGSSRISVPTTTGNHIVQILNEKKIVIGSIPMVVDK